MIDWRQWHGEPFLADLLVLLGWLYALLVGPLRPKIAPGEAFPRASAIRFYPGLAVLYVAVASPLERIGQRYLFSAEVLLQMLIVYPAAGWMLLGLPQWLVEPVVTFGPLRWAFRVVLKPLVGGAVFVLVFSGCYLPRVYEWSLRGDGEASVISVVFLGVGFLFWWPLVARSEAFPSLRFGGRMIYLFCLEVALTAVFSYLLMAEHPMYPTYDLAPRLIPGLGAQDDQVLGGILLSGLSSLVLVGSLGVNFLAWARKSEKQSAPR